MTRSPRSAAFRRQPETWPVDRVLKRYALLAGALALGFSGCWATTDMRGVTDPVGLWLELTLTTLLGPLAGSLAGGGALFVGAVTAIFIGVVGRKRGPARAAGYVGIVLWFLVGGAMAGMKMS